MGKKMAVVGAGAAGSYIGAFLTREGHDIVLIDMWGEHVEKMNSNGIDVSGSQGPFNVPVQAYHFYDASQLKEKYDIIFFAMKSYDTIWAAHFAKNLLSPNGVLVSNQNCMNDLTLASIVGFEREIGCVMSGITVGLWEPGHVNRGGQPGKDRGHDVFRVGELHGRITPRAEEIAELLSCIDGSRATSNIWGERWSKLTTNASSNPITAMTGLGSNGAAELPEARRLQIEISKESCRVALAQNFDVEPIKGITADVWSRANEGDIYETNVGTQKLSQIPLGGFSPNIENVYFKFEWIGTHYFWMIDDLELTETPNNLIDIEDVFITTLVSTILAFNII
mgnify:CR=1 FL=1